MKNLLAILLFAIAGIAYLQFDPLSDKPKAEPVEVVNLDFNKDSSDAILAAAFDASAPVEEEKVPEVVEVKTVSVKANRSEPPASISQIEYAFKKKKSDVQVRAYGSVLKLLSDDNKGSRHQRFLVKLANEQTLLIAHNIDLAPKITALKQGDRIEFYGEYEWNAKGGVVHWTHKDPNNKHKHGWLKHKGKIYQ
ncbi:DUF3465 domain-containing protein [Thalassomonas sp. M1454]|uniref:DUF3465 domain-containing protein n=1 Tax=Thalassomonas sp. M1454 TaxID=2594477 RepID=UPI00117C430D|nr:DUF3465 domain-containing protein [Thalassomonas sp. M1454]TRX52707.1 DUF3465 domain-containing protein [Thalassomonas sp. M1454]